MQRRSFLARLSLASALTWLPVTLAMAHTPYRFWNVFRKRNMQIMTSLEDEAGDDKGEAWVAVLRDKLPLSRAMVSRAHKLTRTASLLKTDQVKIAVLSHAHAQQMLSGAAPFTEFVPMQLEILVDDGQHLLVCRTDVPLYHGYLITMAHLRLVVRVHLQPEQLGARLNHHRNSSALYIDIAANPANAGFLDLGCRERQSSFHDGNYLG